MPAAGLQSLLPSSFVTQSWSVARPSLSVGSVNGALKLPSAAPPPLAWRAATERRASNWWRSCAVGCRSGLSGCAAAVDAAPSETATAAAIAQRSHRMTRSPLPTASPSGRTSPGPR